MAALDDLREHWPLTGAVGWGQRMHGLGTELLVRATRSISTGSLLNAESGRADTRARIEDWAGVLSLYDTDNESRPVRVSA